MQDISSLLHYFGDSWVVILYSFASELLLHWLIYTPALNPCTDYIVADAVLSVLKLETMVAESNQIMLNLKLINVKQQ